MTMRTVVVVIALASEVPALAISALAADEPGTFGMAQLGSLEDRLRCGAGTSAAVR